MDGTLHSKLDSALTAKHSAFLSDNDDEDDVIGGYLEGNLCWLANGSHLKVLIQGKKNVFASHCFVHSDVEISIKITCCKKYGNLLLVGLQTDKKKGLLYLFNPHTNRVVKAVEIPYAVTSLEVVLTEGGATAVSKLFSQKLRYLFGVVAVGTEEGHLYLLDLRLDDEPCFSQTLPAKLEAVPTALHDIPQMRHAMQKRSAHIAFELLDSCHEKTDFYYTTPEDQIIETFEAQDISITSLYFEYRTTSLYVGHSFGQFQIFDLTDLSLTFSSVVHSAVNPVVAFAFQEPENDPRNCCYLWIVKSSAYDDEDLSMLTATMFQLVYQKKEIITQSSKLMSFYQGLESCSVQYDMVLDSTLGLQPVSSRSRLLQCNAIERSTSTHQLNEFDREYCSTPHTSLLVFGWETLDRNGSSVNAQVLLFDINSWYVAHMPQCYRGFAEDLTYIALWELGSALPLDSSSKLLSLFTPPTSLRHLKSKMQPVPEQFVRPSALSLITYALTGDRTMTCKMHGIQQQVLFHLLESRSECLLEPTDLFEKMIEVGLIEQIGNAPFTVERKREKILTSALNHNLFGFVSRVILDLSSGKHAGSSCTLRFIMEWAWKSVAIIKDRFDDMCVPIFDCSCISLDQADEDELSRLQHDLADLGDVFKALSREAQTSTEQSKAELETKQNIIQLIHGYIRTLRWFIQARLLPEQLEGHICPDLESYGNFRFVYKQQTLRSMFEKRRKELAALKNAPSSGMLMIDGMIEDAGENLKSNWEKMSSDQCKLYPPPSIMALLDMYYLSTMEDLAKHSIATYFLLDMLALVETSEEEQDRGDAFMASKQDLIRMVAFFPENFHLPSSTISLIKAFWLLDHKEFSESLTVFCDAGTETAPFPWQHRTIMLAYMTQGHCDLALKYLLSKQPASLSVDDVKLKIDIYTKTGLPSHALEEAQKGSDMESRDDVYGHLFSCCHHNNLLHSLLMQPISRNEDDLVSKYLQSGVIANSHHLLILYHLKNSKFSQAIKSYQQNKHSYMMAEHDEASKLQHEALKLIIQAYANVLPDSEREMAFSGERLLSKSKIVRKEVMEVKPLSAILNARRTDVPLSHADIYSLFVDKNKKREEKPSSTPFRKRSTHHHSSSNQSHAKMLFAGDMPNTTVTSSARKSISRRSRSSLGAVSIVSPSYGRYSRSFTAQEGSPALPARKTNDNSLPRIASILLQTPPIQRKAANARTMESDINFMTPQSILKVKLLRGKSPSLPVLSPRKTSNLTDVESGSLSSIGKQNRTKDESCHNISLRGLDTPSTDSYFPSRNSSGSVDGGRELFMDALFSVATPRVDKQFKGIDLQGVSAPQQQTCTPKRLRFFGLNTSSNDGQDTSDTEFKSFPPSDNVVVVQAADEDAEVDVTGDVADDVINTSPPVPDSAAQTSSHEESFCDGGEPAPVEISSDDLVDSSSDNPILPTHVTTSGTGDSSLSDAERSTNEEKSTPYDDVTLRHDQEQSSENHPKTQQNFATGDGAVAMLAQKSTLDDLERGADDITSPLSTSSDDSAPSDNDSMNLELSSEDESPATTAPDVALNTAPDDPVIVVPSDDTESSDPTENLPSATTEEVEVKTDLLLSQTLDKDSELPLAASSACEVVVALSAEDMELRFDLGEHEEIFPAPVATTFLLDDARTKEADLRVEDTCDSEKVDSPVMLDQDRPLTTDAGQTADEASVSKETEHENLSQVAIDVRVPEAAPETEVDNTVEVVKPPQQSIQATKAVSTPITKRLQQEPVFLLSPPTTRNRDRKKGVTALARSIPSADDPHFALSPVETRTRSTRKRSAAVDVADKPATPGKKLRFNSPTRKVDAAAKPPLPPSSRKARKTPSRKPPVTPSRSSSRIRTRNLSADQSAPQSVKKEMSVDGSDVTSTSAALSIDNHPAASSEVSEGHSPPAVTRSSSRKRATRHSVLTTPSPARNLRGRKPSGGETTDSTQGSPSAPHVSMEVGRSVSPPTTTRTGSKRRTRTALEKSAALDTPSKRRTRSSDDNRSDQPRSTRSSAKPRTRAVKQEPSTPARTPPRRRRATSESATDETSEDQATVSRTNSRRQTRSVTSGSPDAQQPVVARSSSRRKGKSATVNLTVTDSDISDQPVVTRSSSRRRAGASANESSRKRKVAAENSGVDTAGEEETSAKTKSSPSRTKQAKRDDHDDAAPTVTRTSSRRRAKTTSQSDEQSSIISTRKREKLVSINVVSAFDDETVSDDDAAGGEHRAATGKTSIFDESIKLVEVPERTVQSFRTSTVSIRSDKAQTRSHFPIVARRRAKVVLYRKHK